MTKPIDDNDHHNDGTSPRTMNDWPPAVQALLTAALPDELALAAELAGLPAAFVIAERFGGRQQYLPREPEAAHDLVAALGMATAQALWPVFGNGRIRWPLAKGFRIRYRYLAGETVPAIAAAIGVSENTVYALCRGLPRLRPIQSVRRPSRLVRLADERAGRIQARLNGGEALETIAQDERIAVKTARQLSRRAVKATPAPVRPAPQCPHCGWPLPHGGSSNSGRNPGPAGAANSPSWRRADAAIGKDQAR